MFAEKQPSLQSQPAPISGLVNAGPSERRKQAPLWLQTLLVLGVSLITLLLCLVCFEYFASSQLGLGQPVLYNLDPRVGYRPKPQQLVQRRHGAEVLINAEGLRATRPWSEAASQKLLFLGDSVTYGGSYIDTSKLFSEQVCQRIRSESSEQLGPLCGNAGVNGWGLANIAALLRLGQYSDADMLVVTLISGDAERGLSRLSGQPYWTQMPQSIFPATEELIWHLVDGARLSARFGPKPEPVWTEAEHADYVRQQVQNLLQALPPEKPVLLLHSPNQDHLQNGYDAIDQVLFDELQAGVEQQSLWHFVRLRDVIEDWTGLHVDYVHYSEAGHTRVATLINQELK